MQTRLLDRCQVKLMWVRSGRRIEDAPSRLAIFMSVLIVGSLSGSRLKSVRFLVGESSARMTSSALAKIIKINH